MPTAFVLSGGASLGAVQVGMLRALLDRGITPDFIVGSSVGAINGGWLAGSPHLAGVDKLEEIWHSISRSSIFPLKPLSGLLGFLGRRTHLVPPDPLEQLLGHHLPFARLEDAAIPLHIVATDVADGVEVLLSRGDAVRAILASAAIPGVFPPVRIGAHDLMDGGVVDNNPISHAVHLGATVVYVLPTGYSCALLAAPRSALGMVLHALNLMTVQRLLIDIERYEHEIELRVIPPPCPLSVSPADFSRTAELIAAAHAAAETWLDSRPPLFGQRRLLGFHHHARPPAAVRRVRDRRAQRLSVVASGVCVLATGLLVVVAVAACGRGSIPCVGAAGRLRERFPHPYAGRRRRPLAGGGARRRTLGHGGGRRTADGSHPVAASSRGRGHPRPIVGPAGVVYAAGNAGVLHAIDLATGRDRWSFDGGGSYGSDLSTSAALCPDRLLLWPGPDDALYGIDATTGSRLWRRDFTGMVLSPALGPDRVYIGTTDGHLEALTVSRRGATVDWSSDLGVHGEPSYGSPAIAADGTVYETVANRIVAVRDAGDHATILWHFDIAERDRGLAGGEPRRHRRVGNQYQTEYGLDPRGTVLWRYPRDSLSYSSPRWRPTVSPTSATIAVLSTPSTRAAGRRRADISSPARCGPPRPSTATGTCTPGPRRVTSPGSARTAHGSSTSRPVTSWTAIRRSPGTEPCSSARATDTCTPSAQSSNSRWVTRYATANAQGMPKMPTTARTRTSGAGRAIPMPRHPAEAAMQIRKSGR